MKNFFLTKPTSIKLDKQEILVSEFDFEKKVNTNTRISFAEIGQIAFISDSTSITKGAIKHLEGKNISFINKGIPTAILFWLKNQNKIYDYSQKMACLPKSKQKKLAFAFCKAVCTGRINEIRRLNEKRKDPFLKERLKQMQELETQLKKVYKDNATLKAFEGNIAKHFFACIRHLLPKETGFEERNRFGLDIYNVLLNSAHGLLRKKIAMVLLASGLNTSFGFLHFQKDKSKPFLVWDFAEFWIPRLDKICFYAINKGIFSNSDLINAKEVALNPKEKQKRKWLNHQGWQKLYRLFDERIDEKQIEAKCQEFCDYLEGKRARFKWVL